MHIKDCLFKVLGVEIKKRPRKMNFSGQAGHCLIGQVYYRQVALMQSLLLLQLTDANLKKNSLSKENFVFFFAYPPEFGGEIYPKPFL
jgi:hypothetical protein